MTSARPRSASTASAASSTAGAAFRRRGALAAVLAVGIASGCARHGATASADASQGATDGAPAAGSPSSAAATSDAASPGARAKPERLLPIEKPSRSPPSGEARRTRVAAGAAMVAEPALASQRAALDEHFGPGAKGPFDLQVRDLGEGRSALLVERAGQPDTASSQPLVLVLDGDRLAWSKPHPVWGIVAPVRQLALGPRADGGAVLFAWVVSLHTVAARMWADDGNAFGDFEVFSPDACDALAVAYAEGAGWIAACSSSTGTKAQRLREDATAGWTRDGLAIGMTGPVGPPAMAFDSPSSFVLVQRAAAIGGDRLLAYRYDLQGRALWPTPVYLGVFAGTDRVDERERIAARAEGIVRIELPRPLVGKAVRAVDVSSRGAVRFE